jgi:hypothetical protein
MGNVALRTAGLTKRYGRGIALAAGAAGLISLRRRDLGDLGTAGLPGLAGPVRDRLADHFFPPAETP